MNIDEKGTTPEAAAAAKKARALKRESASLRKIRFSVLAVLMLVYATVFRPHFIIYPMMVIDYLTPFSLWNSPLMAQYHQFILKFLPESEEMQLQEIQYWEATEDKVMELTNNYTQPLVIRGMLKDAPAVKYWNNATWWLENYPEEKVLCQYVEGLKEGASPECTIREYFGAWEEGRPFYISGASQIFKDRPELAEMVETPNLDDIQGISPGKRVFTQIFMGFPGMGSDVHTAIGTNFFRQIAGRKQWWFMPSSMTPYVFPAINANGFSCHTKTKIGKGSGDKKEEPSPWFRKLTRYTTILEPGDVLINTAWYWHGIVNMNSVGVNDPNELVIGVPTRYNAGGIPAFRSNPVLSAVTFSTFQLKYGGVAGFTDESTDNLQKDITANRVNRAKEAGEL